MRFIDWFTLEGIRNEIKKISWPTRKELTNNSAVVIFFCLFMGLFFFGGDVVIAAILKALGMK